jgi:hypothetical protein
MTEEKYKTKPPLFGTTPFSKGQQTMDSIKHARRNRQKLSLLLFGYVALWWTYLPTPLFWIINYWIPLPGSAWLTSELWLHSLLWLQILIIIPYFTIGLFFMLYFLAWTICLLLNK